MNMDEFNDCMDSSKYKKRVKANYDEAVRNGAQSTPMFIIISSDGKTKKITGSEPYSVFAKVIESGEEKSMSESTEAESPSALGQDSDYDPLSGGTIEYYNSHYFKGYSLQFFDYDAALAHLEKAIELENQGHDLYAELSDRKKFHLEEIAYLDDEIERAHNVCNDDICYVNSGTVEDLASKGAKLLTLGSAKRVDEAIQVCKESLTINESYQAFSCLHKGLVKKGDWAELLKQKEYYPHLNRQVIDPYRDGNTIDYSKIMGLYHLKKYNDALTMIEILEDYSKSGNDGMILLQLKIAILEKSGRQNEADIILTTMGQGWSSPNAYKAYAFLTIQDWDKVVYYKEKAMKEDPVQNVDLIPRYVVIANYYLEQQSPTKQIEEVFTSVFEEPKSSGGCGAGTVMVNGVCQLAPTQTKTSFMSIEPIYLIIGAVGIGGAIAGVIAVAKRGSGTPKPAREELEEYEEKYLAKEKPVKQKPKPAKQKPVEKKETSAFCENCGKSLKPTAKFCGGCGTKV